MPKYIIDGVEVSVEREFGTEGEMIDKIIDFIYSKYLETEKKEGE